MKYEGALKKEYQFWMDGEKKLSADQCTFRRVVLLPDGSVLNRYWDDNDSPRPEAFIEDIHIANRSNTTAAKVYRDIRAAAEQVYTADPASVDLFKLPAAKKAKKKDETPRPKAS